MFALKDKCNLTGEGNPCDSHAITLVKRVLDRLEAVQKVKSDRSFEVPKWTEHIRFMCGNLLVHKDKFSGNDAKTLDTLASSNREVVY
jgi:hypothetical protein